MLFIPLAIASITILFFLLRYILRLSKKDAFSPEHVNTVTLSFIEFPFMILFPVWGILMSQDKCGEHPFKIGSLPTVYTIYISALVAYFSLKYFLHQLSPIIKAILMCFLLIGLFYCIALCIHFAAFTAQSFIIPIFLGPLISPFICLFLIVRMFRIIYHFQKIDISVADYTNTSPWIKLIIVFIEQPIWKKNILLFVASLPVIVVMQVILYLFGQAPDSIITHFTESCGFILSNTQDCSCGGDHYLCSIAANGSKKLVKPSRLGFRQNKIIKVNRQLLIANAFENWLEEYTPKTHKVIRNFYDNCGISVNKWSKRKKVANIIYILMKPLEWLFLLWLYLFDKNPETRIAKQYLPKQQLEKFIKTRHHEN